MFLPSDLNELSLRHLNALKDAGVQEGMSIDYKETLELKGEAKRDFFSDVTALANALGGDLVYGIKEKRENGKNLGVIDDIVGIECPEGFDALQLTIRNSLNDNVVPRIPTVSIGKVDLPNNRIVLVLRVGRSHLGPHTYKDWCRFYVRNGNQNSPADMNQIRSLFLETASTSNRLQTLVDYRLDCIDRAQPLQLWVQARWVLHVIPIQALDPNFSLDIGSLADNYLAPIGHGVASSYPNIDGWVTVGTYQDKPEAFALACKTGLIETANCGYFAFSNSPPTIHEMGLAAESWGFVVQALSYLRKRGVLGPFFITGTLVGVAGYTVSRDARKRGSGSSRPIDRPLIRLPLLELKEESSPDEVAKALKPLFDGIANAAGYLRSAAYDD